MSTIPPRKLTVLQRMQVSSSSAIATGFRGQAYNRGEKPRSSEDDFLELIDGQHSATTPAFPKGEKRKQLAPQRKSLGTAQVKQRKREPAAKKKTPAATMPASAPADCSSSDDDNEEHRNQPSRSVAVPAVVKERKLGERQSSRQRLRPLAYWKGEVCLLGCAALCSLALQPRSHLEFVLSALCSLLCGCLASSVH